MSDAMASFKGQSSITARNEVGSAIGIVLGQSVLNGKDILSYDCDAVQRDNAGMDDRMSETEEKAAFISRVRQAREAKFKTQKPVYEFLGIPQGKYKHYEIGRELPRKYIPKFCTVTEVSMTWLLTGEGKGPEVAEIPRDVPKRARGRPRAKAA